MKMTINKANTGNGNMMMRPKDLPIEKKMKQMKDKLSPAEKNYMGKKRNLMDELL